jgi:hypothetical protein
MSTTPNDGGPAFPVWELNGQGQQEMTCFGMTLRDYFAAKLAPGLFVAMQDDPVGLQRAIRKSGSQDAQDWVAKTAYSMADEMLKARQS